MVAIQNSNIGVASTLMGLAPVFLLPVGRFVFKESFSWQSVAGTLLAVVGIGMLFR
jgi:drug/metabolite transporter (DMT)-like permease